MTIFIKNPNIKLYENLAAGTTAVPCKPADGRTDGPTDSHDDASSPFGNCTANGPNTVVTNCHKEMENLVAGYVIKTFLKKRLKQSRSQYQHIKFRSKCNAISLGLLSKKIFQNTRVRALFLLYAILRLYIIIIGYVYAASANFHFINIKFPEGVNILININSYEGYSTSKVP